MLDGEPYRRTLERDGKPLNTEEQRSEQKKFDRETRRLSSTVRLGSLRCAQAERQS